MAAKYWVIGGKPNEGDWFDNAYWSLVSGGAGGTPYPSASDMAIFDANSGTGICHGPYYDAAVCQSISTVGSNIELDLDIHIVGYGGGGYIDIGRPFNVGRTVKVTDYNIFIYCNGNDFGGNLLITGNPSPTVSLQDNFGVYPSTTNIYIDSGSLLTNSNNIIVNEFVNTSLGSSTSVSLGTSMIRTRTWRPNPILYQNSYYGINTATFMSGDGLFYGGSLTYGTVIIDASGVVDMYGQNTFTNLTINPGATLWLNAGSNQTVSNFICDGTASPILIRTDAITPATITNNGSPYTVKSTSIYGITAAGPGKLSADQSCVDLGNNTNWDFLVGTSKLFLFFGEFA